MDKNEDIKEEKPDPFRKGVLFGVAGTLAVICAVLLTAYLTVGRHYDSGFLHISDLAKARVISGVIDQYYYKDVSDTEKTNGVFKGLMEAMGDPYTRYLTAEEYEEEQESNSGEYVGIGVGVSIDSDTRQVVVGQVYEGSSAEGAGILKGDIITAIDGTSVDGMTIQDLRDMLRGEAGTTVSVTYTRDGETHTVQMQREEVEAVSVYGKMLDETAGIGYIEITEFNSKTESEFLDTLALLKDRGMKAVIYDLRANQGGLVDSVTAILDDILPAGTTVYMMDKYGQKTTYTSDDEKQEELPTVVLTSGVTASSAEIFSGAVRDFDYGTLIGTKTFGKGIVQQFYTLGDGSALKLTVQTYYTPSGESIHEKGIEPDIELEYKYSGDASDRDSRKTYDLEKDNQVERGIEVLKQKLED